MDIRTLKYFLAIAKEGNITKAAELLHTTQPNLSKQIKDLEDELGKQLFERKSRNITLTEEGLFLKRRAQDIIELVERVENEIISFDDVISGTVHIGAIETGAMHLFSDALSNMKQQYPDIQYDFFSGSVTELTDMLRNGLLDFAIIVSNGIDDQFDHIKLPIEDRFGIIMRKDHPLASHSVIHPEDIKDHPIWISRHQLEGNVFSGWLKRDISTLNIVATFTLITTPSMFIEDGFGIAFTFDELIRTDPESTLTFRPLSPSVTVPLYLIWQKNRILTKQARLFLEEVQRTIQN